MLDFSHFHVELAQPWADLFTVYFTGFVLVAGLYWLMIWWHDLKLRADARKNAGSGDFTVVERIFIAFVAGLLWPLTLFLLIGAMQSAS